MTEKTITKNEDGRRLDSVLRKVLKDASDGFIYKALRKKSITLNGKKAEGSVRVREGDVVRFWFTDETVRQLSGESSSSGPAPEAVPALEILYEDEDVLLFVKPVGLLSQKAVSSDVSANDWVLCHAKEKGLISGSPFETFQPSICNRLDRNTGGIMAAGMSLMGLRVLSELFRDRTLSKKYYAIVLGEVSSQSILHGYLLKDASSNRVEIFDFPGPDRKEIRTGYQPVRYDSEIDLTLLKVKLFTGKTHQIRAHLSSIGHPILGDEKYGIPAVNLQFHRNRQCLFAYEMTFPECELEGVSGRTFKADIPKDWPVRPEETL